MYEGSLCIHDFLYAQTGAPGHHWVGLKIYRNKKCQNSQAHPVTTYRNVKLVPHLRWPSVLLFILARPPPSKTKKPDTPPCGSSTVIYIFEAIPFFGDSNCSFTETMNKPVGRLVSDAAEPGVAARSTQYRPASPPPAPGSLHPDRAAPTPPCVDISPPLHRSFHFSVLRSTKLQHRHPR